MQTARVAEAVAHTSAAGIARLWLDAVSDPGSLKVPEHPRAGRRDPSLRGLVGGVWDKGFELFLGQVLKRGGEVVQADGFLDLGARRSAHDYGAYAVLVNSSVEWSGLSGRDLSTLDEEPARAPNPLWLFDLLRGVTEASEAEGELVRERPCSRLEACSDIHLVSERVPGDTPLPPGTSFEALRAVPLEAWIDDSGLVRRIRYQHRLVGDASQTHTLELFDFGTDAAVDWSRLPLLRDPRTGAAV